MNNYSDIDAISLLDIWRLLAKRKILFWTIFLLIFIGGSIFTITKTPQYNYTQLIELPSYVEKETLVAVWSCDLAAEKINKFYFPFAVAKYNAAHPDKIVHLNGGSLTLKNVSGSYLSLSMKGPVAAKDVYKEILQTVIDSMRIEIAPVFENKTNYLQATMENLQNQKNNIIRSEKLLKAKKDGVTSSLLHNEYTRTLIKIDQQILDINYKLSFLRQVTATDLIRSTYPVDPSKTVMFTLFILLGLMFGFFAVFVVEFISKNKGVIN